MSLFNLPNSQQYIIYIIFGLALLAPYLWLRSRLKPVLTWKQGGIIVFFLTLFSPIILENDYVRYLWDGLNLSKGFNPYAAAPALNPNFSIWPFQSLVNHPDLPTIYPPLAQIFFALSAWINPFLSFTQSNLTLATLGLKFCSGVLALTLIYLFRGKRWDLVAFHPLFLSQAVFNVHLDLLVMTLIMASLKPSFSRKNFYASGTFLAGAILTKWYPLVLLPVQSLYWMKRDSNKVAILFATGIFALVVLVCLPFYATSNGNFFASLFTYGEHWIFFGFLHGFLCDLFTLFGFQQDAVWFAKISCGVFALLGFAFVLKKLATGFLTLRLASLLVIMILLACLPTLHPWYVLVLIPLSIPYQRSLVSPWLWPILAHAGFAFYVYHSDPILIRYAVYCVLMVFMVRDYKKIF